jgi:hypothetical protein
VCVCVCVCVRACVHTHTHTLPSDVKPGTPDQLCVQCSQLRQWLIPACHNCHCWSQQLHVSWYGWLPRTWQGPWNRMAREAWMENSVLSRTWHTTGTIRGKFCNAETLLLIFRRRHIVLSLRHRISARNTADAETYFSKKCDTQLRNSEYLRKNLLTCTDFYVETEIPKGPTTRYGLEGPKIESRWGTRFSAPLQTGPGAHPSSYKIGTGSFPGVIWTGRGVDHPPPSSAEVKERVDLYLYSPSGLSWSVLGWTLPLPLLASLRRSCCREYP